MKTYSQHLSGTGQTSRIDIIRKPVLRSSAIFPYLINNKIDNKFLLLGYWLLKRNIKEILLLITIRSKDGKMAQGKTGVARLAAHTGAAVVPVAIRQTDGVWPVSKRVPRPWRKFYYKFGEPIYFRESEASKENLREFTDKVMKEIEILSKECEDYWESRKILPRMKKYIKSKLS